MLTNGQLIGQAIAAYYQAGNKEAIDATACQAIRTESGDTWIELRTIRGPVAMVCLDVAVRVTATIKAQKEAWIEDGKLRVQTDLGESECKVVTVDTVSDPEKLEAQPADEIVLSSRAFATLDLADFADEPAAAEASGEKPETCQVVGCRREASCSIELIEDDGRREIGRYCERHGCIED